MNLLCTSTEFIIRITWIPKNRWFLPSNMYAPYLAPHTITYFTGTEGHDNSWFSCKYLGPDISVICSSGVGGLSQVVISSRRTQYNRPAHSCLTDTPVIDPTTFAVLKGHAGMFDEYIWPLVVLNSDYLACSQGYPSVSHFAILGHISTFDSRVCMAAG